MSGQPPDEPVIDMGYLSLPVEVQEAVEADVAARRTPEVASPAPVPAMPPTAIVEPSAPVSGKSPGQRLHEARQAGGARRPRPWPPEDWADRHPDLRALDEEMAEAAAAPERERAERAEAERDQVAIQLQHAKAAAAGSHEGIRLWMLDCGELVAKHRARAEAAESTAAEIREVITTYFTVHGNNTSASLAAARDLAEGVRQVLDRVPLGTQERSGGEAGDRG